MNPKQETVKFIEEYLEVVFKSKDSNVFTQPNKLFEKISKAEFIEVLKDPVWINMTQSYIYSYTVKHYGYKNLEMKMKLGFAGNLIYYVFKSNHPYSELIVKYADGLLLRTAIESCIDNNKTKMVLRGLKSKDFRVRKVAARYCPVSKLESLLKDPRREVRWSAINRLGLHNIADKLLDDPAIDIRLNAAIFLERSDVIEDILEKEYDNFLKVLNNCNKNTGLSYQSQSRLMKIISKISKQELVYNINLQEAGSSVKKMIEARLYEVGETSSNLSDSEE